MKSPHSTASEFLIAFYDSPSTMHLPSAAIAVVDVDVVPSDIQCTFEGPVSFCNEICLLYNHGDAKNQRATGYLPIKHQDGRTIKQPALGLETGQN